MITMIACSFILLFVGVPKFEKSAGPSVLFVLPSGLELCVGCGDGSVDLWSVFPEELRCGVFEESSDAVVR